MSWQATAKVDALPYDAVGQMAFRVLLKLANASAPDGSRAFMAAGTIASELGVSIRSVQRGIKELEHMRLIIRGDQRHVHHLRADQRPVVYDINMHWQAGWEQLPLSGVTEFSTATTRGDKRYDNTPDDDTTPAVADIKEEPTEPTRTTRVCARGHELIGTTGGGMGFCELGHYALEAVS